MDEYVKPPLGVAPHWFVYPKRIKELNEAIAKYLEFEYEHRFTIDTAEYFKQIAKWANDIKLLAECEEELLRKDKREV